MDRLRSFSAIVPDSTSLTSSSATSSLLRGMTVDLERTYMSCAMRQETEILTRLTQPLRNGGFDNADGDFILKRHATIVNPENRSYEIRAKLGQGTFGQVARCGTSDGGGVEVAVKVIKNRPTYFNQALIELRVLQRLNERYERHIVKMLDYFVYRKHLVIVFELLHTNLYELIKSRNYTGLSAGKVVQITRQLLEGLCCLRKEQVIHCDIKPENLMLTREGNLKLIDLGSAAFAGSTPYPYIQSRFYRSTDVILGLQPFSPAIDMWSFGCVLAELAVGVPFFPGGNEHDQLCRIVDCVGPVPDSLILRGRNHSKFYRSSSASTSAETPVAGAPLTLVSAAEYRRLAGKLVKDATTSARYPVTGEAGVLGLLRCLRARRYENAGAVDNNTNTLNLQTAGDEEKFLQLVADLMKRCFIYDPHLRLLPHQALNHPLFQASGTTPSLCTSALQAWQPVDAALTAATAAADATAAGQAPAGSSQHHVGSAPVPSLPALAAAGVCGGGRVVPMTPDGRVGSISYRPPLFADTPAEAPAAGAPPAAAAATATAAPAFAGTPGSVGASVAGGAAPSSTPQTLTAFLGQQRERRGRSNSESEIQLLPLASLANLAVPACGPASSGSCSSSTVAGLCGQTGGVSSAGCMQRTSSSSSRAGTATGGGGSSAAVQTPQMLQESLWRQACLSRQALLRHQHPQQPHQPQQQPAAQKTGTGTGTVAALRGGKTNSRTGPGAGPGPGPSLGKTATYRS